MIFQPPYTEPMALFMKFSTHVLESHQVIKTDMCLAADPGVASSIPARSHTFTELIMK